MKLLLGVQFSDGRWCLYEGSEDNPFMKQLFSLLKADLVSSTFRDRLEAIKRTGSELKDYGLFVVIDYIRNTMDFCHLETEKKYDSLKADLEAEYARQEKEKA